MMENNQCHYIDLEKTFNVSEGETILEAAYRKGIELPYRCGTGSCGVCKLRLVSGDVKLEHSGGISASMIREGYILPCCTMPLTSIVIRSN